MGKGLFPYILKRLLGAIPTLLILATFVFFLMRFAPGGPFDGDRVFPKDVQAAIDARYGLDLPLWQQYLKWLSSVTLHFDFGESFQYVGRTVNEMIGSSLPPSLLLGGLALVFAVALGVPLGVLAAWRQGTWMDSSAIFLAIAGVSLPSYLIASTLVLVFSLKLGWFPPALWEERSSVVLPVITLGLRPLAITARLVRASVIETLSSDYIRTAYAKGQTVTKILFHHALRNSLIPVITVLGPLAASLVTGSFLVEMVFQVPGLGKHFVGAVLNRDYPMVMGVTLVYGAILIVSNLLVDVACAMLDPRIRLETAEG
ncbi:MAG: ABC transporter permease [Bdellovibrionales bacterium]|nr:ABC transporter permease [Bdellovibrionales bacterium]